MAPSPSGFLGRHLRGCLTEFFCEGVSPKKSLVKIREPSHTRRFASERGEFSPNGVAIWIFGSGRVKGSPIPDLRRQRRSGARLRGKQGRQSHLIPCGSFLAIH